MKLQSSSPNIKSQQWKLILSPGREFQNKIENTLSLYNHGVCGCGYFSPSDFPFNLTRHSAGRDSKINYKHFLTKRNLDLFS